MSNSSSNGMPVGNNGEVDGNNLGEWENYDPSNFYSPGNAMPTAENMERIGFHESQEHLLCGKHALNNILQEEKYVWENNASVTIDGEDPLAKNTKINLFNLCKIYEKELKTKYIAVAVEEQARLVKNTLSDKIKPRRNNKNLYNKPQFDSDAKFQYALEGFNRAKLEYVKLYNGKSEKERKLMIQAEYKDFYVPDDELCNTTTFGEGDNGMLPINIFPKLLDLLNYDYVMIKTDNRNNDTPVQIRVLNAIDAELSKPLCLGVVVNVPEFNGHWTAIVKYRKNCLSITEATRTEHFIYTDSLKCSLDDLEDCRNLEDLKQYLIDNVIIRSAIFIYEKPDGSSYMSQAQLNRDSMQNNPLNRIQVGGRRVRKTRKQARKMKASRTRRR